MSYRRRAGGDTRTFPERKAALDGGDKNAFGPDGKLPTWEREDGDDLRILWECLLWFIWKRGFLARCYQDPKPKTATNAAEFHSHHTTKFLEKWCSKGWLKMQTTERKEVFQRYLYGKFDTTPKHPKTLPRKADIKWDGFYLTPLEFDGLVDDAFSAYCHYAGHAPTA